MQPQAIFGLIVLAVAIWTVFRVFKNVFEGVVLILMAVVATALVIGGAPELGSLPIVGNILPQYNISTSDIIVAAKGFAWGIKILAVEKAGNGNTMIAVANTGQLDLSEFRLFVNGQQVPIINLPKSPLKKGETAILEASQFAGKDIKIRVESGSARDEIVK